MSHRPKKMEPEVIPPTSDLMFVAGPAGQIVFTNPAFQKLLGYTSDELFGYGVLDLIHAEDRLAFEQRLASVCSAAEPLPLRGRFITKSGPPILLAGNCFARKHRGELSEIVAVLHQPAERHELERKLAETTSRLKTIIQTEPECVKLLALDGTVVEMNPAGFAMLEVDSPSEVIGKPAIHFVAPEHRAAFRALTQQVLSGHNGMLEFEIIGAKGSRRWVETHAVPVRDDYANISGALGITRDISERKRAEDALRKSEHMLRAVVDNVPVILFAVDAKGVFTASEGRGLELLGLKRGQVVGRSVFEVYGGHPTIPKLIRQAMAGKAITASVETAGLVFETRYQPQRNGAGKVIGVVGVAADVTERRRAEEALRRSEENYRMFVERASDGIFTADQAGRYVDVNSRGCEILGYSRDEILRSSIQDIVVPDERKRVPLELKQLIAGETVRSEWQFRRKDGSYFPGEVSAKMLPDGRLLGFLRDMSDWKRTQNAMQDLSGRLLKLQDEERRRIARDLHDTTAQNLAALTTTLTALSNEHEHLSPKGRRLLRESLSLARLSSKEIRTLSYLLHPPLLDEIGLSAAVTDYARGIADRSGIQVRVHCPGRFGRLSKDIETAFFRVVQECLGNILRHSRSKTAVVRFRRLPREVMLEIEDSGRGIGIKKLRQLNEAGGALGVGIPGMRERMRQLGGRLEIQSSRRGTRVRAMVPLTNSK